MAVEMVKKSPSQEKYSRVQFAIRLMVLVVFLGWILIWIMAPTNTYKQIWLPHLRAKMNSTYFGAQGLLFDSATYAKFTSCLHALFMLICYPMIFFLQVQHF